MFIQCQHCNAAFKIDESKVPDKSAFVRCAKCSNPIPLNKQEQTEILKSDPQKIVECNNCHTRYSIPLEKFDQESVKVRCGKCENIFHVSKSDTVSSAEDDAFETMDEDVPTDLGESAETGLFDSDEDDSIESGIDSFEDDIGLDDISIPEENEIEMDSLYDNVEGADSFESGELDETESDDSFEDQSDLDFEGEEPSEDYLDSISLSAQVSGEEDIDLDGDLGLDEVSSEERYKLFLKPEGQSGDDEDSAGSGIDEEWPEIEDETEMVEMGQEISDFTGLDEMGVMPGIDESGAKESLVKPIKGGKSRKPFWIFIILIIILAIVAAGGWFYMQSEAGRDIFPQKTERYDSKSKLKIQEPLKGRMVFNKSDRVNMFLLEGQVRNTYPVDVRITWIEIKGVLYDKQGEKISEAVTYAGINLTNAQLEDWSEDRIKSYIKFQSDKIKQEFVLTTGRAAPFQIVFFKVPKTIQKLEASINRFGRAGQ